MPDMPYHQYAVMHGMIAQEVKESLDKAGLIKL